MKRAREFQCIVAALLVSLSAGCGSKEDSAPAQSTPPSTDTIKEEPSRFYGKSVTLSGEVDEVYSDRAFELEGTGWAFDDNITVLSKSPIQLASGPLVDNDEIVVTGVVRPFVTAEIERDLGWDLGPEVEVKLERRPVVIAERVRKVEEVSSWSASGGENQPVTSTVTVITQVSPAAFAGRKVDLDRERVQSVAGKGVWIGSSRMAQVFVLPAQTPTGLKPGDLVDVKGTLQQVPKDAAKAWNLPSDMKNVIAEEALYVAEASLTKVSSS